MAPGMASCIARNLRSSAPGVDVGELREDAAAGLREDLLAPMQAKQSQTGCSDEEVRRQDAEQHVCVGDDGEDRHRSERHVVFVGEFVNSCECPGPLLVTPAAVVEKVLQAYPAMSARPVVGDVVAL